jgi:hypothetical protein
MTKRDAAEEEPGPVITWSLRGRTYVPLTTPGRDSGRLDEDRARSMSDEGGPDAAADKVADNRPE